jgi:hypothetical protein
MNLGPLCVCVCVKSRSLLFDRRLFVCVCVCVCVRSFCVSFGLHTTTRYGQPVQSSGMLWNATGQQGGVTQFQPRWPTSLRQRWYLTRCPRLPLPPASPLFPLKWILPLSKYA